MTQQKIAQPGKLFNTLRVLSFNLWDPDDYKAFEEAGGHRDKCPDVVGKTARWAAEILLED